MSRTSIQNQRRNMILQDTIPAQSEIRKWMGSSMADVFFEHCHPDSKQLLGVIPPLEGPHEELWISPSDQLIQKVALVPPLTNNHIKACTHQGILALGQRAMEKYERDMYEKMIEKYEDQKGEAREMFEAEKRRAVELAEQEIQLKYEKYIEALREEFEQKLQCALAQAFRKCSKSMQKAVVRERIEVTRMMLIKLRKEISYIINFLYEKFEDHVRAQKENMIADFNEIIRRENAKSNDRIQEMERQKYEALELQRHELEMRNFADLTYVLCLERGRSSSEKHAIHLCFEKKIQTLKNLLAETKNIMNSMEIGTKAKETKNKSWENKLPEVLREFQKFIDFAFKAVPGQADYLLSLESLLKPEIDDNKLPEQKVPEKEIIKPSPPDGLTNPEIDIVEIVDSSGGRWIPMQMISDLPKLYCTKEQLISPIVKSEIELCTDTEYIDEPSNASVVSLNTYDSLPFCHLENVLYVRSDYHEKNEIITKTISQLAEGSRFIMELKEKKKSCNLVNLNSTITRTEVMDHITDSLSTPRHISENSILNGTNNSRGRTDSKLDAASCFVSSEFHSGEFKK